MGGLRGRGDLCDPCPSKWRTACGTRWSTSLPQRKGGARDGAARRGRQSQTPPTSVPSWARESCLSLLGEGVSGGRVLG